MKANSMNAILITTTFRVEKELSASSVFSICFYGYKYVVKTMTNKINERGSPMIKIISIPSKTYKNRSNTGIITAKMIVICNS